MTQSFCQHVVYEKITLLRSYLFSAIYNKILTLDESILKEKPVMVLISSDFSAIEQAFLDKDQDETWSSVLSVGIGMCILYSLIGPASLLALIPASGKKRNTQKLSSCLVNIMPLLKLPIF